MRLLITGACGHIGSYLARRLPELRQDLEFVLVDNMMTQRYASLFSLPPTARYRFVERDVISVPLDDLMEGVDAVIHLAAITDATRSFQMGDEVRTSNLAATDKVSDACAAAGVPVVVASSTSVYGPQVDEVDEFSSDDVLNPQSPYAETKLAEEALVATKAQNNGLRCLVFRFGTIFGTSPGMRFHTAVNKFCWQAVMGEPLTVWRTAMDQQRPYLALDDAARAIDFVLERQLFDGGVYNVVTINAAVRDVVQSIQREIPNVSVKLVDSEIMNQHSYRVLNTKLGRAGFDVAGSLEQSVSDTIALLRGATSLGNGQPKI